MKILMVLFLSFFFSSKRFELIIFLFSIILIFFSKNFLGIILNSYLFFDFFSVGLCLLRLWVGLGMMLVLVNFRMSFFYKYEVNIILIFLIFLLLLRFICTHFFLFYVSFEFVVVPTFFLILGMGYSVERLQAGLYIFVYTLLASIPFLFLIVNFDFFSFSYKFDVCLFLNNKFLGGFWWIYIRFVFLVKLPIFLVHLWLPKAHVEAPLVGSMILAGVLLKLGGYGIFKSIIFSYKDFFLNREWLYSLGLMGSVLVCFICVRQIDLKCLIAYSSVVHIGPVLCSLVTFSWLGFNGCYFMMLSHGICSSGLFYMLNLIYERWSSRRVLILKGRIIRIPILSFWWFFLCVTNIGCPPTFNFVSEFFYYFKFNGSSFIFFLFMRNSLINRRYL